MGPDNASSRLEYHLGMEALLLRLAERFLSLTPGHSVDRAIEATLEEVGRFAEVDICTLLQIDPSSDTVSMTHRWANKPEEAGPMMATVPVATVSAWVESLRSGKPQVFDDIREAQLPEPMHRRLERAGVRALIVCPMLHGSELVAWIGISVKEPHRWREEERTLAKFVANAFAHALRRHRDEIALRHSEARFMAFLEQNPDAMYVLELDPPIATDRPIEEQVDAIMSSQIVLCNEPGGLFFGHSGQEIVGMPFSEAFAGVNEDIIAALRQNSYEFVKNAYRVRVEETPWVMPDGRHRWVSRSAYGVIENGRLTWVWASARDITHQKQARDEREALARRLQQAERLESVGLLAGGIAHDFNNLLLAILGNADLAVLHLDDVVRLKESLHEIRHAGQRAAELTRQLLAFSRRQPTVKKPLALNDLMASTSRLLKRLLPETIDLDFIPGHDLGTVLADEAQVEQLLLNLCINARDAMPNGGRLTMETQNVRINGEYCRTHPWATPGRYVLLLISDTGKGIPETDIEHIFEPFYTTKGPGHGTGLGLATVYGIAKQHGGMVHVYSEVGVGTTFKIYLPITEQKAGRLGAEVRPAPPHGTETVLLAEDEDQVRSVARRILERAGYKVVTAANGSEAVDAFSSDPDRFGAVILDVVMPTMNGREARARILELRPHVPIVFSSGYTGTVLDDVNVHDLGAPVLAKPYDPDELLVAVRRAIDNPRTGS